jgi:hypothetical protein
MTITLDAHAHDVRLALVADHHTVLRPTAALGCTNDLGQVLLISRGWVHARTSSPVQPAVQG